MPDIATPASSPARSSTWIEATVVPSDCASFAWASTVARPERIIATPEAAAAAIAAAVAIFTRAEKAARRVFAASISRPKPAEAAVAGLADALELGPDLAAADHGEPDADAFLSHGCLRPLR